MSHRKINALALYSGVAVLPANELKAWHERLPAQVPGIVVPETGDVKAHFVLGIKNLSKY